MNTYTKTNHPTKPGQQMRKASTIRAHWITEPFRVKVQDQAEPMTISPEECDDWDGGYWIAYPDDGSDPYPIAPKFIRDNYAPV